VKLTATAPFTSQAQRLELGVDHAVVVRSSPGPGALYRPNAAVDLDAAIRATASTVTSLTDV
jgi:hypothetical protein